MAMISFWYLIMSLIGLSINRDQAPPTDVKALSEVNNKCTLYIEGNGSVNCTADVRRSVCDVECDGKHQGVFICTEEDGWSTKLPYCARDVAKANAQDFPGCQDDPEPCNQFCREVFGRTGECTKGGGGKDTICICRGGD